MLKTTDPIMCQYAERLSEVTGKEIYFVEHRNPEWFQCREKQVGSYGLPFGNNAYPISIWSHAIFVMDWALTNLNMHITVEGGVADIEAPINVGYYFRDFDNEGEEE